MAGVTKEEIARAKELDLLTYFKLVEPGNLKLVGKEYRHKVHSSLTISKDSLWCWHCIGLRGRTALKYLIDVEKVPYVEAVREMVAAVCPGKVGSIIDNRCALALEKLVQFQVGLCVNRVP